MNKARFFANADISNYLWLVDLLKQDSVPTSASRPLSNEIVVPGRVTIMLSDGKDYAFADPIPAALGQDKMLSELLLKICEVVLKICLMTQWEELFHYNHWLVYSESGKSAFE